MPPPNTPRSEISQQPIGFSLGLSLAGMEMPPMLMAMELVLDRQLKELGAHQARAQRLRTSDSIQALLRLVRGDPDFYAETRPLVARGAEFIDGAVGEGQKHRNYTRLFAGLAGNAGLRSMLEKSLDRQIATETQQLRARIKNGYNFVNEMIFGSGANSACYSAVRFLYAPDGDRLTIEKFRTIGGQFERARAALWKLNSKNKPVKAGAKRTPGSANSLNTLGSAAVLDESDLTMMSYGTNREIALATRVNGFMSGHFMVESEVISVRKNPDRAFDFSAGRYEVEFYFPDLQLTAHGYTNRIASFGGLGDADDGLDRRDPVTNDILKEQKQIHESGGNAAYRDFNQYAESVGDDTVRFPFKGVKTMIVWGAKDSGAVTVGSALGYETQLGQTVAQLDRVEKIYWVGQAAMTKDEFIEDIRCRYSQLGLEFPREKFEDYYARIIPIDGKAVRLDKDETGQIVVVVETKDETLRLQGDLAVSCSGFKNGSDKVFKSLEVQHLDRKEALRESETLFMTEGTRLFYGTPEEPTIVRIDRVEQIGDGVNIVTFRKISPDGTTIIEETPPFKTGSTFIGKQFFGKELYAAELPLGAPERELIINRFGDRDVPIAQRLEGEQVFFGGPEARLPLTDKERQGSPFLASIPENTAAIFRYGLLSQALAEFVSLEAQTPDRGDTENSPAQMIVGSTPRVGVLKVPKASVFKDSQTFRAELNAGNPILPLGARRNDFLRLIISEYLMPFSFQRSGGELSLNITRKGQQIKCEVKSNFELTGSLRDALKDIIRDPLAQEILRELTVKASNPRGALNITIPVKDGKSKYALVDGSSIDVRRVKS